jgi:hypothetical protein
MDRDEVLRREAAKCLALARATTDPKTRAELLHMAQRFNDLANRRPADFDAIVQIFNDQQMRPVSDRKPPVVQQQQQVQPKKTDGED